ncbi:MAG: 6-carboxytetrahydropterin synthase [Marinoscillum sp.]
MKQVYEMLKADRQKLIAEVKEDFSTLKERVASVEKKLRLLGSKSLDPSWPTAQDIENGDDEYEVTQRFTFDAGHSLKKHPKRQKGYGVPHGHSWTCYVTLRGRRNNFYWLVDFDRFETLLIRVRALLDHKELNQLPGLEQSTMENISKGIGLTIQKAIPRYARNKSVKLVKVRLCRESIGEECTWFAD